MYSSTCCRVRVLYKTSDLGLAMTLPMESLIISSVSKWYETPSWVNIGIASSFLSTNHIESAGFLCDSAHVYVHV